MATFLVRDFHDPRGYVELTQPGGGLRRVARTQDQEGESFVPWAITLDQRVVYARTGQHTSFRGGSGTDRLRPYDTFVSQNRRRLAESELGVLALDLPHLTRAALDSVSHGLKQYLIRHFWSNQQAAMDAMYTEIGHYFYTGGGKGFGRISEADKKSLGPQKVWQGILDAAENGSVDQKMAIYDAAGRKLLAKLKSPSHEAEYKAWGSLVRERWFDDKDRRGRTETPEQLARKVRPTNTPGIAPLGTPGNGQMGNVGQARNRGVDMFQRDPHRMREKNADIYYDDADTRNLLFGAGISGTTGTLLQAGRAFGGIKNGEPLKQFVLAIVGYLVGGGMHSYHESMAIAQRVGLPYNPGAYVSSLPESFLASPQFTNWRDKYYDVVVMGATHWRFNPGVTPSHLNRNLR